MCAAAGHSLADTQPHSMPLTLDNSNKKGGRLGAGREGIDQEGQEACCPWGEVGRACPLGGSRLDLVEGRGNQEGEDRRACWEVGTPYWVEEAC